MDFASIIGKEFAFYGVDNNSFKLDDIVWTVIEDPSDGYRSYLDTVQETKQDGPIFFSAPLATVHITYTREHGDEMYRLVDVLSGHVWLQFGTEDEDDYYPMFIFYYNPVR